MRIVATGSYLPETIYDNEYMSSIVDTNDEWITTRTGIKQRHIAKTETLADMCERAAIDAMQSSGITAQEIGTVICATLGGETVVPTTAAQVLARLGIKGAAFDVNSACTGFLYALKTAQAFLGEKKVLVIGGEALTKYTDYKDRSTCILFGDGAGAVIVDEHDSLEYIDLCAYGDEAGVLSVPGIGYEQHYVSMNGQEVFKFATREIDKICTQALQKMNMTSEDIRWVVLHQANLRIIKSAAKRLRIPLARFFINIENTANTSAASIPIALDGLVKNKGVSSGDRIMLIGFGGGLSSGVAILKWM